MFRFDNRQIGILLYKPKEKTKTKQKENKSKTLRPKKQLSKNQEPFSFCILCFKLHFWLGISGRKPVEIYAGVPQKSLSIWNEFKMVTKSMLQNSTPYQSKDLRILNSLLHTFGHYVNWFEIESYFCGRPDIRELKSLENAHRGRQYEIFTAYLWAFFQEILNLWTFLAPPRTIYIFIEQNQQSNGK